MPARRPDATASKWPWTEAKAPDFAEAHFVGCAVRTGSSPGRRCFYESEFRLGAAQPSESPCRVRRAHRELGRPTLSRHPLALLGTGPTGLGAVLAMLGLVLRALLGAGAAGLGAQGAGRTGLGARAAQQRGRESAEARAVVIQLDTRGHLLHLGLAQAGGRAGFAGPGANVAGPGAGGE